MPILTSLALIIAAIFALAMLTDQFFIPSLDEVSSRLLLLCGGFVLYTLLA